MELPTLRARHAPGLFHRKKGGISASLSADAFAAEAAEARLALLQRFPVLLLGLNRCVVVSLKTVAFYCLAGCNQQTPSWV